MYNTDLPRRADLPTSAQLKRSTWIASIAAAGILAFVVLPSEYAIDPTGVGRMMGLTQMGEIKMQLAQEAAQDAAAEASPAADPGNAELMARLDRIEATLKGMAAGVPTRDPISALIAPPPAPERLAAPERPATPQIQPQQKAVSPEWRDEISIKLPPGQGAEVKLIMQQGAQARFHWTANGSVVNYDTHGDGGGKSVSYEQGRGVPEQEGVLQAAFTGNHGWFWRNRTNADVIVTLKATGAYSEMKRMK